MAWHDEPGVAAAAARERRRAVARPDAVLRCVSEQSADEPLGLAARRRQRDVYAFSRAHARPSAATSSACRPTPGPSTSPRPRPLVDGVSARAGACRGRVVASRAAQRSERLRPTASAQRAVRDSSTRHVPFRVPTAGVSRRQCRARVSRAAETTLDRTEVVAAGAAKTSSYSEPIGGATIRYTLNGYAAAERLASVRSTSCESRSLRASESSLTAIAVLQRRAAQRAGVPRREPPGALNDDRSDSNATPAPVDATCRACHRAWVARKRPLAHARRAHHEHHRAGRDARQPVDDRVEPRRRRRCTPSRPVRSARESGRATSIRRDLAPPAHHEQRGDLRDGLDQHDAGGERVDHLVEREQARGQREQPDREEGDVGEAQRARGRARTV